MKYYPLSEKLLLAALAAMCIGGALVAILT